MLKLGLSNYSQEQIESFLDICEKNGYVKPSYYQGQYNALCRHDEDTFLPMLRKNKISYIAYRYIGNFYFPTDEAVLTDVVLLPEASSPEYSPRVLMSRGPGSKKVILKVISSSRHTTSQACIRQSESFKPA